MPSSDLPQLGDIARDIVTGFTGCAVAIARWYNNCDRLMVQPRFVKDDNSVPDACWFDVPTLEKVGGTDLQVLPPNRPPEQVELMDLVEDRVTHLRGRAMAHVVYMHGCSRFFVQPTQLGKDGSIAKMVLVDELDLVIVERWEKPATPTEPARTVRRPDTGGPRGESIER